MLILHFIIFCLEITYKFIYLHKFFFKVEAPF